MDPDDKQDGEGEIATRRSISEAARALQLRLKYLPFPKQCVFHASAAKYRLFGGAAGPGKTKALLMEAILQAHDFPGVNTLLLRRTFPELEGSLLQYFRREVPRDLYRSYSESKHQVEWLNGSVTRFGYCANENDVYQYQGGEYLFIGVDELTHLTLRQWQFLTSRNRCSAPLPKYGRRDESRKHRPQLGESAVGGPPAGRRHGTRGRVPRRGLRFYSRAIFG